jgi:hypothetical protein
MWRIAVWVVCVSLAGCVSNKKDPPAARKSLLPRADFILENNDAFFAKPDEGGAVPKAVQK